MRVDEDLRAVHLLHEPSLYLFQSKVLLQPLHDAYKPAMMGLKLPMKSVSGDLDDHADKIISPPAVSVFGTSCCA